MNTSFANVFSASKSMVIAELSANHNGSLDRALATVRAAAESGADAVKLQTYTADTLTIACQRPEFIVSGGLWKGRSLYDLYQEAHTPWEWHPALFEEAKRHGLPIFSTPFDASAVSFLEELGVELYKIASFEIVDLELIEHIARTRKPIIMSTGMANLAEIDEAVRCIRNVWGNAIIPLCLLHCVSEYPASPAAMNLRTIPHLRDAFGVISGLSD
ncbi:MAG: N-acetylneuraminate synthase family protein, partial [Myxococcota bacterium]|nr:N-acetylneuraminate synthase family protein [Myxococcota bacterium]